MNDTVQQIKDRLSIVDVVSSYIKLEKTGKNFRAKSPFSNEKTPSFYVSPDRGMYYCFSTNQGGDIFTFVEKLEGVGFKGALKILAERAGVELKPVRKGDVDELGRLHALLEEATRFFEVHLGKMKDAQEYIIERGLTQKSITTWRIGYAPLGWSTMLEYLKKRGFSEREMDKAGLIKKSEKGKGYYDRFRGRVVFPIFDPSGRVIAYSGRILPRASNSEFKPEAAKYLNSPETELFSKSHVLYGYSFAKNAIRKFNCSILVEGQIDVVLSHQAGYTNTVAVSGTALTENQLSLLARLSNNVVVAFDADRAGVSSAGKGIALALARGMDVKVAALPKGTDPADLVRSGAELWREVVRNAKHVIDFYLDYLGGEYTDPRRLRLAVGETVIPFLTSIPNRIDQAHFVSRVAERLKIGEMPIWEEVKKHARKETVKSDGGVQPAKVNLLERFRRQTIEERLAVLILWQKKKPEGERSIDVALLEERLRSAVSEERFAELMLSVEREENKVLFEAEMFYDETHTLLSDVEDLLINLEEESLRDAYVVALEYLRSAELVGDKVAVNRWLSECKRLGGKLGVRVDPLAAGADPSKK